MVAGRKPKKITPPFLDTEESTAYKEYVPDEDNLLEVSTTNGTTFKNLFDTLKAILNEANIEFSDKGMKLLAVDTFKNAMVHLFMEKTSFDYYHLKEPLELGVDIEQIQKSIKSINYTDTMCLTVKRNETHILNISFTNATKGTYVNDKIELLSLPKSHMCKNIEYSIPASIQSRQFQDICKQMATLGATLVEIEIKNNVFYFRNVSSSTKIKREVVVNIEKKPHQEETDNDAAIGVFHIKFLKSFAKAANLNQNMTIYLKTNHPLICEYSVGGLALLRYVLLQHQEP